MAVLNLQKFFITLVKIHLLYVQAVNQFDKRSKVQHKGLELWKFLSLFSIVDWVLLVAVLELAIISHIPIKKLKF